ncbi:MAG: flagellar biosynthesis protein FlhB [Deferribacteraceae bacterium]|jgi:flagellar biosynthetic protein FlhB|nr:flagellar biosynthesis protein FlhB [Deferribacteraceae bacterium]
MANDEAGEKTEEPTSKQFEKAQDEGNVAKSRELTAGIFLTLSIIFFYFYFPYFISGCEEIFREFFAFEHFMVTTETVKSVFYLCIIMMAKLALPFLAFFFIITFMAEAAQVGIHFSSKALNPKWDKVNFFTSLPKFFQGKRKLMELAKSIFKIVVLGWVAITVIQGKFDALLRLTDAEFMDSTLFMGKLLFEIVFKMAIAVVLLGVLDFAFQKWQHRQDLKMTKQQIKEEYKQMEGDPLIRQRIRSAQQELARKRMMADVTKADMVVANPTHYAVALKYDPKTASAPYCLAKGQRLVALRIKDIARENGIYIHEDPPLAQTLYKTLEIGDAIPENLYKAIVEILAIVYKKRGRSPFN